MFTVLPLKAVTYYHGSRELIGLSKRLVPSSIKDNGLIRVTPSLRPVQLLNKCWFKELKWDWMSQSWNSFGPESVKKSSRQLCFFPKHEFRVPINLLPWKAPLSQLEVQIQGLETTALPADLGCCEVAQGTHVTSTVTGPQATLLFSAWPQMWDGFEPHVLSV